MSKHLAGVTHALVSIPTAKDAKQTGVMAVVDLCFGQGDTAIGGLRYIKADGQLAWHAPMVQIQRDGSTVSLPVFRGELLIEVCKLASQAIDRVKKDFGKPAWGQQYVVLKDKVVVLQEPERKAA